MKYFFYKKTAVFICLVVLFFCPAANICFSAEDNSPDAIAIRVIPNPNHYSAVRWYKENIKNGGAPQALTVDGYEAVRDGRTVYVNAANIVGSDFFSNIYLISYNQQAQTATVDIFSSILIRWKFNSNVDSKGVCYSDQKTGCSADSDCASVANDYCLSEKARVVRDTNRLADLADLNTYLANYTAKNGIYPKLSAGSYLTGKSTSAWPSWQDTLGKILGQTLPVDPINKLQACRPACCSSGDCVSSADQTGCSYNQTTCWSNQEKRFKFNFNNDQDDSQSVTRSNVYWYQSGHFFVNLETENRYNNLTGLQGVNFASSF